MRANPAVLIAESSGISECLDRLAAQKRSLRPLSTYRLQFNAGFTFRDARQLVGYLHALGVSHIYSSPVLKARPGSPHGYDITDHNQLNPEVGSYEELQALVRELKDYGMGQVLDFVPNHMGIGEGENPWWRDVLANGRTSEFAEFFDLDWEPIKPELKDKLLIPILGDQYGAELERGRIRLAFGDDGFHVEYFDKVLPLDPQTIPLVFDPLNSDVSDPEVRNVLAGLRSLPPHNARDGELVRQRRRSVGPLTEALHKYIQTSPGAKALVERALDLHNGKPGD